MSFLSEAKNLGWGRDSSVITLLQNDRKQLSDSLVRGGSYDNFQTLDIQKGRADIDYFKVMTGGPDAED
jgi:hypothetical protein